MRKLGKPSGALGGTAGDRRSYRLSKRARDSKRISARLGKSDVGKATLRIVRKSGLERVGIRLAPWEVQCMYVDRGVPFFCRQRRFNNSFPSCFLLEE